MNIKSINSDILRQAIIIALILFIGIVLFYNLGYFIPGALGALTMYILFRNKYLFFTERRKWNKSFTSILFIIVSLLAIAIPIWVLVEVLVPQISNIISNKAMINQQLIAVQDYFASKPILRNIHISEQDITEYITKLAGFIPTVLNSVGSILVNIATALFILFFMQKNTRVLEEKIKYYMPFSSHNREDIWEETKMMVKSNTLGIPILALCQGIVAAIGYWIFGVNNPILWGLVTGAFTIVPVVGTMVIWVPIVIIQIATKEVQTGIFLAIYCLAVVGTVDNILRFTILKTLGDVPPLITVFGVIVGLNLFGVMGLIFGPLLMSYFLILLKVYRTEFSGTSDAVVETNTTAPVIIETNTENTPPSQPNS